MIQNTNHRHWGPTVTNYVGPGFSVTLTQEAITGEVCLYRRVWRSTPPQTPEADAQLETKAAKSRRLMKSFVRSQRARQRKIRATCPRARERPATQYAKRVCSLSESWRVLLL